MITTENPSLAAALDLLTPRRTIFFSLLLTYSILLFGASSHAQSQSAQPRQEAGAENSQEKRRIARVLSNAGHRKVSEARESIDAEDYESALVLLEEVVDGDRYSDYDKAKALQMRAFVEIGQDRYQAAISSNTQALDLQVLDAASERELIYSLANLYAFVENYPQSIHFLELWFERTETPDAQAYFIAAQVYALAEQLSKALSYAEQGMAAHIKEQTEPRESWYRLLLAVQLQSREYTEASELLQTMLVLWPDRPDYYRQLSGLYQELDRQLDALLITSVAKQNGLLSRQSEFERLAQMYRYHDYPYKGALVLDSLLNGSLVSEYRPAADGQDWKVLGDAYAQGREWQHAKEAYLQAAPLASTGDNWLQLCQAAYRDGLWAEAKQYCKNAIDKAGLGDDQGHAWQIIAMAHYHSDKPIEAMDAFRTCSNWLPVKEACTQWLDHIDKQIEQQKLEEKRRQKERKRSAQQANGLQKAVDSALYFQ